MFTSLSTILQNKMAPSGEREQLTFPYDSQQLTPSVGYCIFTVETI